MAEWRCSKCGRKLGEYHGAGQVVVQTVCGRCNERATLDVGAKAR